MSIYMRKIALLAFITLLLSAFGCSAKNSEAADQLPYGKSVTFTDALGHSVSVTSPRRVVAASGSFAQVWLLAGGQLAGATQDAFADGFVSEDNTVNIGGNHSPSLEQILALNPGLVILSANIAGQAQLYEPLSKADVAAACFSVETFQEYLGMLKICTDITGRSDLYALNGSDIQDKIDEIISRAKDKPAPKILLLRAGSGKVSALDGDSMAGAMLKDLGCVNIADGGSGLLDNLSDISLEVIIEQDPGFIFATTMGDSVDAAQKALRDTLLGNPAWADLSAVKNGRYITLPKDLFHKKPNNRWAEAYEQLWEILYGGQ